VNPLEEFGGVRRTLLRLFGRYRGTVSGHAADGVHGVCESFRARL
jgi:hypothetical protein